MLFLLGALQKRNASIAAEYQALQEENEYRQMLIARADVDTRTVRLCR